MLCFKDMTFCSAKCQNTSCFHQFTNELMEINIITHPKLNPERTVVGLLVQCGTILVGVALGSAALQWSGFIVSWIILILMGADMLKQDLKENTHLTIEQARKRLDVIEAWESKRHE